MYLYFIVIQVALEIHKDLAEIQPCIWIDPELPESSSLDYRIILNTLCSFGTSQYERNNQALKCDHHTSDLVSSTYKNESWQVT